MKKHSYHITMDWTGNLGTGTSNYRDYSRDHMISSANKQMTIPGSSDPAFKGDTTRYNPEELLVSTISSCHMLWYLHLCATNDINVISYTDNAIGEMEEFANGSGRFIGVTLSPNIKIENADAQDKIKLALALHHKAHDMCFIANSVNFEIRVEPKVS